MNEILDLKKNIYTYKTTRLRGSFSAENVVGMYTRRDE